MASESQIATLRKWLKQVMPAGLEVCEMPGEVCLDALGRLHEASEKYNEDKKENIGIVLKTKKEILEELREEGWIDVQTGINETIGAEIESKPAALPPEPIEEEERELEEAEKAFEEENKIVRPSGEETRAVSNPNDFPYTAKKKQQILIALGFKRYDDPDGTNFGIRILNTKIGVKFNTENLTGKVWAYVLTEDNKKEFIKNGDLKELPLVQRYLDIQAGKKPIPEPTVRGRIIERVGKGIKIEIEEDGEKKEIFFGQGAVKKHDDGHHFIPSGFSKPSQDNTEGKMCVPRDILLPKMDLQPTTANREDAEVQRIREEQGRAPAPTTIPLPATEATPKPTVDELVSKYLDILVHVTSVVKKNEGISGQEKGYATNWICNAVKDELEKGDAIK